MLLKCLHELWVEIIKQRKESILDRLWNTDIVKVSVGVIKFRFAMQCNAMHWVSRKQAEGLYFRLVLKIKIRETQIGSLICVLISMTINRTGPHPTAPDSVCVLWSTIRSRAEYIKTVLIKTVSCCYTKHWYHHMLNMVLVCGLHTN